MSERLKDTIAILIAVMLIANIILGIVTISLNLKKADTFSSGLSGLLGNVGLINVEGVITSEGSSYYSYVDAEEVARKIKTFAETPTIKAIRINVTSPGGTVSGAETIVSALDYAKSKGKKIVVFMKEIAASGGYYISAPADYIIASRGTFTGSIGVIVTSFNIKGLFDKIGIKPYTFKSGEYKDILSPYREISEPESKLIQRIIDTYYQRFIEVIMKYRGDKIKKNELLQIADGRILTEKDALLHKLIDEVGDEFLVEEVIKNMIKEETITYVELPDKKGWIKDLLQLAIDKLNLDILIKPVKNYPQALYIVY
ncbi:MAG: signal peptide peptidase SppA [Brevinematia bacterium]